MVKTNKTLGIEDFPVSLFGWEGAVGQLTGP